MAEFSAPLRATVHGFVRGHDIDGDAVITFERESLLLQSGRVRVALLLRSLDGWTVGEDALHIHADGGDFVSVVTTDAEAVARQLDDWAFQLPELTRSLRVFGSRRAAGGERRAEHDAFFAPLLAARGEAARASTAEGRRSALDARKLRNDIRLRLRAYAAERFPTDAPERRALEAELDECASPLTARLADLAAAEERLSASTDAQRLLHWREWARALAALFESADRCWPEIGATLSDDRRESPSRWRRFGRGRRTRPGL
jgi:hypothetical protein